MRKKIFIFSAYHFIICTFAPHFRKNVQMAETCAFLCTEVSVVVSHINRKGFYLQTTTNNKMKKLLLFILALLAGVSGAWAINVKVIRSNKAPDTFGSLASTTFTTNSASGLAGVTIAGITTTKPTNFSYGACLGVESSASGTITMTAPTGYCIYGYTLTARSNTSSVSYTLTPSAGGSAKTTSTGGVTLTASGLSSQTASFTYSASSANSFYIPSMTIIIIADGATVIDVTYTLKYGGVTRGTSTIKQGVGEAAGLPEDLDNGFMTYSYSPATIATSGTTAVTATATWDGPFQMGDAFNTIPRWYRVRLNSNNNFYMYNNAGTLSFNNGSCEKTSKDYLWGFVGNPYDGFQIYNYNLGSSKAIDMANPCTLSASGTSSTFKIAQGKAGSTSSTADSYFALYDPTASKYLNYQSGAIKRYSVDEGSTFLINAVKVVTFVDGNDDPCAVAVDGGSAVSTIYVATNGNDSFTLPDANLYSLDGGTSWKTNTEAVNAIKAAGTDDISVTVAPAVTVTYYLKWNSSTIKTQASVKTPQGFSPSVTVPWTAPDYCNFTYDVATIAAETTEVNVTLNWTGPFDISANYASATWYYLALNDKWARNHDTKWTAPALESDIASVKGTDGALWAFLGNPFDGIVITLKEKYSGSEVYLSSGSSNPDFWNEEGSTEKWTVKKLSATTFTLNCGDKYLIDKSNRMAFKNSALEGSEGTFSVRSYYCQKALDDLADYAEANAVGQYFGVRQEAINAVRGMFEGLSNMSQTEYETTYAVPTGVAGYLTVKYPSTGYYRIKNNNTDNYMAYGTPYGYSLSDPRPAGLIATSTSDDAASVIKLTGSKGTYKLSAQGLNIQSQRSANVTFPGSADTGVDFVFNISSPSVVSITNAASRVDENFDGSLHEATVDWTVHGVVNWQASDDNSKWKVEDATEVTVSMNPVLSASGSFATICFPFDVTIEAPSGAGGAEAYTVNIDESLAKLNKLGSQNVPAGTPVLLAAAYATTSVTATITSGLAEYDGANDLRGTYFDKTSLEENEYILGTKDGKLGFWKLGSGHKLGANKAYLLVPGGGGVKGYAISFDELVDGINTVQGSGFKVQDSTIYNLAGQRISKLQRGVNIVNGKKVLVK